MKILIFLVTLFMQCGLLAWDQFQTSASIFSGVPDANINHHVSATTGEYYIAEADIVAPGIEPLSLTRVYLSGGSPFHNEKWTLLPHLVLREEKKGNDYLTTYDPDGAPLIFMCMHGTPDYFPHYDSLKNTVTNISSGVVSGKTNYFNYKVYRFTQCHVEITTADGTKRNYRRQTTSGNQYFLTEEYLPNGNCIFYEYDAASRIRSISSYNRHRTKRYAQINFEYNDRKQYVYITTHTGDWAKYYYTKAKDGSNREFRSYYWFESNTRQEEKIAFDFSQDWKKFVVSERLYQDKSKEIIKYYRSDGEYNVHGHGYFKLGESDPRLGKVESVGIDIDGTGNPDFLYQILYHIPSSRKYEGYIHDPVTEIVYATHARDKYQFSKYKRLKKKTRFNKDQTELYSTDYYWGTAPYKTGNLLRQDESGEGCVYLTKEYTYNDTGDVILEKTSGDLTGEERTSTTIHYEIEEGELHLIRKKIYSDGRIESYSYIQGTNLPEKVFLGSIDNPIQRRVFYIYDDDLLLVKKIEDDGHAESHSDLQGATYCKSTYFLRRTEYPALGYPEEIRESGYDFISGEEKQICRTYYHYDKHSRIIDIDTYDAEDNYQYSRCFAYDAAGRCIIEMDPLGRETHRTYAENGLLLSEKRGDSKETLYKTYDNAHRLIAETITTPDGLSKTHKYSYNTLSHLMCEIDELGNETKYDRDEHGYLRKEITDDIDQNIKITEFVNDYAGRPKRIIDPEGRLTLFSYTGLGKLKLEHLYTGPPIYNIYYANGLLKQKSDPEKTVVLTYDAFQRVISEETSPNNHCTPRVETKVYSGYHLLSETDFRGIETSYTYDYAGRIQTKTTGSRKEVYEYDLLGNLKKEKLFLQTLLIGEIQYSYDIAQRKIEEKQLNGKGETLKHIKYTYDIADNILAQETIIDSNTYLQTWEYDGFNRIIKETDRSGTTILYEYIDGITYRGIKCRKKIAYMPNGLNIEETYHPNGNLLLKIYNTPLGEIFSEEEYTYNRAGDLIRQLFDGSMQIVVSYIYDERARLIALEEQNGLSFTTTTMIYDKLNRLIEKKKPDGVTIYKGYDAFDQEIEVGASDRSIGYVKKFSHKGYITEVFSDITGKTTYREYDKNGNLQKEIFEHGYTIKHHFDDLNRKKQTVHPDGKVITYQYRGEQLKKISYSHNGHTQTLHSYDAYNEEGSLLQETRGDGSSATYKYDDSGRFLASNSSTYNETVEGYTETGNILAHTATQKCIYTYDELDQITSENGEQYVFNPFHLLVEKNDVKTTSTGTKISAFQNATYEYDLCGRRSKKITPEGETTYTYDGFDRLISITTPEITIQYTYDVFNRLIAETADDTITHYIYDDTLEIGSLDQTLHLQELRVLGLGQGGVTGSAIALFVHDEYYIPVCDILGNIRALYTPDQTLIEEYNPTIFGEALPKQSISSWIYQSKRYNSKTGLIYFGDRFYDPEIIGWISPDPLSYHDGPNLYQFLKNNPFKYTDEYGDENINVHPFVPLHEHQDYNIVPRSSDLYCYYDASLNPTSQSIVGCLQYVNQDIKYIDGLSLSSPNAIIAVNGMNNTHPECVEMSKLISKYSGGYNVHYIYNKTHGLINDVQECIANLRGYSSKSSKLLQSLLQTMYKVHGDKLRVLIVSHSQGGIHVYNALENLDEEIKKCIHVLNIAGARLIPTDFAASSINYRAHYYRDPVPYLQYTFTSLHPNPLAYANQVTKDANIRTLKSHPNAPLFDHTILSPTYQEGLEKGIKKFIKGDNL